MGTLECTWIMILMEAWQLKIRSASAKKWGYYYFCSFLVSCFAYLLLLPLMISIIIGLCHWWCLSGHWVSIRHVVVVVVVVACDQYVPSQSLRTSEKYNNGYDNDGYSWVNSLHRIGGAHRIGSLLLSRTLDIIMSHTALHHVASNTSASLSGHVSWRNNNGIRQHNCYKSNGTRLSRLLLWQRNVM